MSELVALLEGREVGTVRQERGRLSFTYAPSWRTSQGAYPLSISMPLASADHGHAAIESFIWGLLPDNEFVLSRWAQRFNISARNPFALISHVGEDCAGAVQFVTPERAIGLVQSREGDVAWITEAEVAERLRQLKVDASTGRLARDAGQFSLAGAQPKTALIFDGQRWGVPSGRVATTHILKPSTSDLDGHAENEHLCLALARSLGLPAALTQVRTFDDVTAIVVERYDRVDVKRLSAVRAAEAAAKAAEAAVQSMSQFPDAPAKAAQLVAESAAATADSRNLHEFGKMTPVYRVHQEDLCQALAVHPARKYQNEGGPGPKQIVDLLRANVFEGRTPKGRDVPPTAEHDIATFLDALIFNWLVAGTDAHAKNYSLLLGAAGLVRLAPLYDVASILAYSEFDPEKAKLAMKVGGEYRLREIGLGHWRALARELRVDEARLIDRLRAMAAQLPDFLADEIAHMRMAGISHAVLDRLAERLPTRVRGLALSYG